MTNTRTYKTEINNYIDMNYLVLPLEGQTEPTKGKKGPNSFLQSGSVDILIIPRVLPWKLFEQAKTMALF